MDRGGGWLEANGDNMHKKAMEAIRDDVRKKAMHAIRDGRCSKVG